MADLERVKVIALSRAIYESLPYTPCRPEHERQIDMAFDFVHEMDRAYQDYRKLSAQMGDLDSNPEFATKFLLVLAVDSINKQRDLFHATLLQITAHDFTQSPAALQVVNGFGQAYVLLIRQQNPYNWLSNFLESRPKFTDYIGGRPDWLPQPTASATL